VGSIPTTRFKLKPPQQDCAKYPQFDRFVWPGEVARMEIYAETPAVRKEAFDREEVSSHKEIDREIVEASEPIRREELDLDTIDRPLVDIAKTN
jgi:stress response protein YsnF